MPRRDRLSQRAFAKKVKGVLSTVQRMCSDGRLPVYADGCVKMPAGLAAWKVAREEFEAGEARASEAAETRRALLSAQVRERVAKAEARELDLRRDRDELVEVAIVHADARACAETIRQSLLALPPRLAPLVETAALDPAPNGTARIEALLADEINRVLEALNRTRFGGGA